MVFQKIAAKVAKVAIDFFSWIKIFENTAFGHVTEVPTEGWTFKDIQPSDLGNLVIDTKMANKYWIKVAYQILALLRSGTIFIKNLYSFL